MLGVLFVFILGVFEEPTNFTSKLKAETIAARIGRANGIRRRARFA